MVRFFVLLREGRLGRFEVGTARHREVGEDALAWFARQGVDLAPSAEWLAGRRLAEGRSFGGWVERLGKGGEWSGGGSC
jgi:hypothetical protein